MVDEGEQIIQDDHYEETESEFAESKGAEVSKNVFKDLISQVNKLNQALVESPNKGSGLTPNQSPNKEKANGG